MWYDTGIIFCTKIKSRILHQVQIFNITNKIIHHNENATPKGIASLPSKLSGFLLASSRSYGTFSLHEKAQQNKFSYYSLQMKTATLKRYQKLNHSLNKNNETYKCSTVFFQEPLYWSGPFSVLRHILNHSGSSLQNIYITLHI